jgi:cell filamentation protein
MVPEGYQAFDDPYVYKGTTVLRNRLGIRDAALLESFEIEMSTIRAEEPLPSGRFSARHYRQVHRHLFQDVYRWAGTYRSVRMGKGGNAFCYPEYIPAEMRRLFAPPRIDLALRATDFRQFVRKAAGFLSELNAIHPFREGNGRTQLAFMHVVAIKAGYPFDLRRVRKQTFLPAMIASFGGNLELLEAELTSLRAS